MLPIPPTPLLGRDQQIRDLSMELAAPDVRLLSLTGPGGIGKTRLAIAIAQSLRHRYPGGIWFVDLIPTTDARLVITAIAQQVIRHESPRISAHDSLVAALHDQTALLVLDNGEHVKEAALDIDRLLDACPQVDAILTTRDPWNLRREHLREVAPLTLPASSEHHDDPETLIAASSAVRLYVERARAVGEFTLTATNMEATIALCRWLDGNPLAIEIAAAQSRMRDPAALLRRDSDRLGHLSWNAPDVPDRHRSMTSLLGWSYDLLAPDEQMVLRRLGVFVGDFDQDAAGAIAYPDGTPAELLQILTTLTNLHLIRVNRESDGILRFTLLETIREFALDCFMRDPDAPHDLIATRTRHLAYFRELARNIPAQFHGSSWDHWVDRITRDHDNLCAALAWSRTIGETTIEAEIILDLQFFWTSCGYMREGLSYHQAIVSRLPDSIDPSVRLRMYENLGTLATWSLGTTDAVDAFSQALVIARELGDAQLIARELCWLAVAVKQRGETAHAHALSREAIRYAESVDAWVEIGFGWRNLMLMFTMDEVSEEYRRTLFDELIAPLRYLRERGNLRNVSMLLAGQTRLRPDLAAGVRSDLLRESLQLADRIQDQLVTEFTAWSTMLFLLDRLPPERVAHLLGLIQAVDRWIVTHGNNGLISSYGDPTAQARVQLATHDTRQVLGSAVFDPLFLAATTLPLVRVPMELLMLLDEANVMHGAIPVGITPPKGQPLTRREREVLSLLAEGMSNKEMATTLSLSDRTIERHVANMYRKIGARRRADAAAFAERHGLRRHAPRSRES